MNTVNLVGRLTKAVDYRQTQNGTSVADFVLAVSRNFKNKNGEREADFILCTAWRGAADVLHQYTDKGAQIGVNGRIETDSYDNEQGQRVYVTKVIVQDVHLLGSKKDNQQQNQYNNYQPQQQSNQGNPFLNEGTPITADDLPFG